MARGFDFERNNLSMVDTTAVSIDRLLGTKTRPAAEVRVVPWYIWCGVIAVSSSIIGGYWDISWHRSIGRDTFWTPAHVAIYLCGLLAGISSAYLILSVSLGKRQGAKESCVKVWGFHGPLGSFMSAWGGIAMLTSAPFDNWWHSAYGLDVEIVSPPHVLLIGGILAVQLGVLILILGCMNRTEGVSASRLSALFLYVGAMMVLLLQLLIMEYTWRGLLHSARAYRVISLAIPVVLIGVARAAKRRWATTIVTAIYTFFLLGQLWILPLFPAEPKLGPVYQKVTHLIPWDFPLLLLVPAVALDLLAPRVASWAAWTQAILFGSVFLITLVAVEWPVADFMMTPAARNWFFGAHYLEYNFHPSWKPYEFFRIERTPSDFWSGMAVALACAILSTRLGLAWSEWMQRVRR
jgi:hypothetical protein